MKTPRLPKLPGKSANNARPRKTKNTITTKSGNSLRVNHSLSDRRKAGKAARDAEKAEYLSTLPKNRFKRLLVRLHPKRVAKYWFSREGGIMALKVVGIAFVAGFLLTIGLFAYFRKDLPQLKDINGASVGGSITYYDRTGQTVLWQDYNGFKRIPVASDQISPYLKQATVAIEDKAFYKEGAFNVRGVVRAGVNDARGGSIQGGSTITEQLVKLNENTGGNRTVTRKIKELILAVDLEREFTKDQILTGYLNIAPYGGVEDGAQAAAQDYFHTDAKNLTLAQAAMLAAIPKSPGELSPYSSTKYNSEAGNDFDQAALIGRQQYILDQMAKQGLITQSAANTAKGVDVLAQVQPLSGYYDGIKAPYFVLAAKQQLEQTYGTSTVQHGGWKVITTLDMASEASAEKIVADNYTALQKATGGLGDDEATVAEDVPTGQIVALVGGVNFNDPTDGKLNFADSELVSPGSTFKPYDYSTLIDNNNNIGASSVLYDSQQPLPGYPCTDKNLPTHDNGSNCLFDYDFAYPGPMTIRYAMGGSRNVPAVKAMLESVPNDTSTGHVKSINKVISTATAMMDNTYLQSKKEPTYKCFYADTQDVNAATTKDETQCYGDSAIGGGYLHLDDDVNGLATLARLGQAIPRTFILGITDADNKTVYKWTQPKPTQPIKADAAYIVDSIADDPNASYLSGSCTTGPTATCTKLNPPYSYGYKFQRDNGWTFAVKTGTTNYDFDGLMASWSPKYAVISWVGNHTRNVNLSSKTGTTMEVLTEPLTRGMMEALHANIKPVTWTQPSTVKTAPGFVQRNHIKYGDIEPGPTDDLYPGNYVGGANVKNTSQTIDKVSGKVATSCTPAAAKDVQTNSNVASWNVDIFMGGHNSISTGTATNSTTSTTAAATDDVHNCNDSPPTITLTSPASCDTSCTITATVTQGTHALTDPQYAQFPGTVTFNLGSNQIYTTNVSDSPSTVSFNYTPTATGSDTLTATVTDSVLYSGSDKATLNYSVPMATPSASSATLDFVSAVAGATNTTFTWTGGSGTYTVIKGSTQLCQTSSTSCVVPITQAPIGTSVTVKDSTATKAKALASPATSLFLRIR